MGSSSSSTVVVVLVVVVAAAAVEVGLTVISVFTTAFQAHTQCHEYTRILQCLSSSKC
jgi:flagellar biosynthesis protein FliQ